MNNEWLLIDTHTPRQNRLGWLSITNKVSIRTYRGRPITILRRLFVEERERLATCKGICVISGPGSFSSIRIGVLYANLLARLFEKSLVGVRVEESLDLVHLAQNLDDKTWSSQAYVAPVYDAEPSITVPRTV